LGYNSCAPEKADAKKEFRENTITDITKLIENEEYHCRSKNGFKGVFTRLRKLDFNKLIVFIIRGIKSSLQRELDSFYKSVTSSDFNIRVVSKSAFTQARAKLKHEAFIELNETVNKTFYNEAPYLVWHNMRLVAVDGTRLVLPKHKSVIEKFGEHSFGPNADSKRSLAIASFLYDPLNLLTLDAQLAPYASSEKELLYKHLEKVLPGDLLLADRGYASFALMFFLIAKGIHFCIRMKENWWLVVKEFVESGEKERIVNFMLPVKDRELLKDYPEMISNPIKCRLIRIDLENGETEVLCTSLTEMEKYSYDDFAELYHFRWGVEECYKLFKSRMEVENFSGKTALAVKQDFFAKVFMMSLCAVLAFPIEEKVRKEYKESQNKHPQKINRTNALAMTRNIIIGLFINKKTKPSIKAFDENVAQTKEIVRPGRSFERKKRPKKLYYMNYKPL
jgi:hypothetical protein